MSWLGVDAPEQRTVDLSYLEELYAKADRLREILKVARPACASYPVPAAGDPESVVDAQMARLKELVA